MLLIRHVPEFVLELILSELNLSINLEDKRFFLIKEYLYTKKERQYDKVVKSKIEKFYKISNSYITKYYNNYHIHLINELESENNQILSNEDKIKTFFNKKEELIFLLHNNIINKSSFITYTYQIINYLKISPVESPTTIKLCLFNYQYYNAILKNKLQKDKIIKHTCFDCLEDIKNDEISDLYTYKDKAIMELINMSAKEDLIAYFVDVKSNKLFMSLYEIYNKKHNVILHTINKDIKKTLIKNGCFQHDIVKSKIDKYVNSKY
jgi:cell fate (sporulation/competence/biofilm development) regulator YlbF (YheA/YmcA/DUF963 family)